VPREPRRTCAACRRKAGPGSLFRLTLEPGDGPPRARLRPPGSPSQGRGAWVCREGPCLQRLRDRPSLLSRAFRREGVALEGGLPGGPGDGLGPPEGGGDPEG
jgi:predicted RNA-binding protein YlxR (DUF448 family)